MAKNKPLENVKYGANPLNNSGGNYERVLQAQFDPFNFSGWNDGPAFDAYGGMPSDLNTYFEMSPEQMSLAGNFSGPNEQLDKYSAESMRNGPSDSSKLALQQNMLGANAGREQARKMAGGMAADATANLAMKGGLGGGAQERIQKQAGNNALDLSSAVDANAGKNRANIYMTDEAARTGNLAQAAGLQQGQNQFRYGMANDDLNRQQGAIDRRNAYNSNRYNQQMQAWGAGKQADATAASGGGKK